MNEIQARIIDINRFCRLCLHEKGVLMDIFGSTEDNHNLDIYQKIKACTAVDLCKGDGLPTRICARCLTSLNAAFEFRIQCENADRTLHEICHLLLSNQIMCKGENENKIILKNNLVEPQADEDKEHMAKQFFGFNQLLIIKRQDNETVKGENTAYVNGYDCACDKSNEEENIEIGDEAYMINNEPKNNITVNEVMTTKEESISLHNSYEALTFQLRENLYENSKSSIDILEKKEEMNMIHLKVGEKKNNVILETKRSACPFCNKMLTRVNEHIRLLHRNKVYICKKNDCGAKFLTLKNLQSHQLKCLNMEKPYKCLRCLKEFYRKCNYKAHIIRHSNKKAFQCQLCDKAFVDSTGLRRHFLKHHEPQQKTFTSGCCGKKFKTKEGLKQHIQKGICGVRIFPLSFNKILS